MTKSVFLAGQNFLLWLITIERKHCKFEYTNMYFLTCVEIRIRYRNIDWIDICIYICEEYNIQSHLSISFINTLKFIFLFKSRQTHRNQHKNIYFASMKWGRSSLVFLVVVLVCWGEIIVRWRRHVRHVGVAGVVVSVLDRGSWGCGLRLFPLSWSEAASRSCRSCPPPGPPTAVSLGAVDARVGRRSVSHVHGVGGGLVREHVCGGHLDTSVRQKCYTGVSVRQKC